MEILIAIALSAITQIFKWLSNKIGLTKSKFLIIGFLFLVSLVYAILTHTGILTKEIIQECIKVATMAIGVYEVVYKRIILPAIS